MSVRAHGAKIVEKANRSRLKLSVQKSTAASSKRATCSYRRCRALFPSTPAPNHEEDTNSRPVGHSRTCRSFLLFQSERARVSLLPASPWPAAKPSL